MSDLNPRMPRGVQAQDERANDAWKARYQPEPSDDDSNSNPDDTTRRNETSAEAGDHRESRESARREEDVAYWKQRVSVLQGKLDAEVPRLHEEVRRLQEQMRQSDQARKDAEAKVATAEAQGQVDLSSHFSEEEREQFGDDTLQLVHRHARALANDSAKQVRDEFASERESMREQETKDSEQRFWDQLNAEVPDWKSINGWQPEGYQPDADYLGWLGESIPVQTDSGVVNKPRQDVLAGYQKALNARGVIGMFQAFKQAQQERARQDKRSAREVPSRAASGNDRPDQSESAPLITRSGIKQFYAEVRQGKWKRDPEGRKAREQEIQRAVQNGQVADE